MALDSLIGLLPTLTLRIQFNLKIERVTFGFLPAHTLCIQLSVKINCEPFGPLFGLVSPYTLRIQLRKSSDRQRFGRSKRFFELLQSIPKRLSTRPVLL